MSWMLATLPHLLRLQLSYNVRNVQLVQHDGRHISDDRNHCGDHWHLPADCGGVTFTEQAVAIEFILVAEYDGFTTYPLFSGTSFL